MFKKHKLIKGIVDHIALQDIGLVLLRTIVILIEKKIFFNKRLVTLNSTLNYYIQPQSIMLSVKNIETDKMFFFLFLLKIFRQ